jgi:hypothetical protein
MKKISKYFLILLMFSFSHCSDKIKKGLGIEKDVPNEFLVTKNKSITKPPTYDLLPPDTIPKNQKSTSKSSNDSLKKIIDNSLNDKENNNNKKINIEAKNQSDLENAILKELSK